ncbi:MAG: hypothetical protein EZS28_027980, partial [Streblomastix strix]
DSIDPNIDLSMFVKDIKGNNTYANTKDLERATNEIWCGREFFPCSTLNQAIMHVSNPGICAYVKEEALINRTIYLSTHSLQFIGLQTGTTAKPRIYYNDVDFYIPENNKGFLIICDATLTITNLAFEISSRSPILNGLIYKDNIGDVWITSCDFYVADESLQAEQLIQGAAIQVNNSVANINDCKFLNIKSGPGGAVYLNVANINGISSITDSHFVNCETQGIAGGAITVDYNRNTDFDRGGLQLKRTEIFNCRGLNGNNQQNAAVYFTGLISSGGNNPLFIDECYFKENGISSTQDIGAHDLYFELSVGSNIINNNIIRDSYSNSYRRKIGGISGSSPGYPDYDYLIPGIEEDYYVDVPVNQESTSDGYGTIINPYRNVNIAVNNLPVRGIIDIKIRIITDRSFKHKSVDINNKKAVIIGRRVESGSVQIYMDYPEETQAMFILDQGYLELNNLILAGVNTANPIIRSISSGTLVINDCEIKGSGSSIFDVSAIITTSGTTTINNCKFNSFEVSKSLFSIGQSRITITNSNFDSIIGNINGLIISEDNLNSNAFITLKDLSFTNLQSTTPNKNGRGSVIFLNIQSVNTPFQFNDLQFSNCQIDSRDSYIYIKTDNLKTRFPNADKFPFTNNPNSGFEFSGEDLEITQGIQIPLYYLWNQYIFDNIHVTTNADAGNDNPQCGSELNPCKTIQYGYNQFDPSNRDHAYLIHQYVDLDEKFVINRNIEFSSYKPLGRATIHISGSAQFDASVIISDDLKVSFNEINILIQRDLVDTTSLVYASGQQTQVMVYKVTISSNEDQSRNGPTQISAPLFYMNGIRSFVFNQSVIQNISRIGGSELAIKIHNVLSATIENSVFQDLTTDGNGAALYITYEDYTSSEALINSTDNIYLNIDGQQGGSSIYYKGTKNYLLINLCQFEKNTAPQGLAQNLYYDGISSVNVNESNIINSFSSDSLPKIGGTNGPYDQTLLNDNTRQVFINNSIPSTVDILKGPYKTVLDFVDFTPTIFEHVDRTATIVSTGADYLVDSRINIGNKLLSFQGRLGIDVMSTAIRIQGSSSSNVTFDILNGYAIFSRIAFTYDASTYAYTLFQLRGSGKIELREQSIITSTLQVGSGQIRSIALFDVIKPDQLVQGLDEDPIPTGTLYLRDIFINKLRLGNVNLIQLAQGATTEITGVQFDDIRSNKGSQPIGRTIYAQIDSETSFILANCTFTNTYGADYRADHAVIYLDIVGKSNKYTFESVQFDNVDWFNQETIEKKNPKTWYIYIKGDLVNCIKKENYNRVDLTNPIPEFYQGYQLLDFPDPVNLDMFITDYSNSIVY